MRHNFLTTIRRVAVLAGLALTAACGTDATAPSMLAPTDASSAVLGGKVESKAAKAAAKVEVKVLGRAVHLHKSITASKTIGALGGTIKMPQTGFSLVVPPGALTSPVKISVTAEAGSGIAYHFEPHGLKFNLPVLFHQDSRHAAPFQGLFLQGGYFADPSQLSIPDGTAIIDEIIQLNLSPLGVMVFPITHFSGYLVSCA